jgi:hypothetical protein
VLAADFGPSKCVGSLLMQVMRVRPHRLALDRRLFRLRLTLKSGGAVWNAGAVCAVGVDSADLWHRGTKPQSAHLITPNTSRATTGSGPRAPAAMPTAPPAAGAMSVGKSPSLGRHGTCRLPVCRSLARRSAPQKVGKGFCPAFCSQYYELRKLSHAGNRGPFRRAFAARASMAGVSCRCA